MKEGWTYKPLGEIATFIKDGDWIESKDQSESGIRLIQTGNVGYGVFKLKDDKPHYITEETMGRLGCTEIFEGDCLVSRLPNPVGRACLIPDIGCRMITAVDCSIIRFGVDYLPQFFVYYTQSYKYLNSIDDKTTGTTRKRISRKNLEKIQIPFPPIAEQERIVERLDAAFAQIDELKNNAERQLAEARALFQSALTQAMQPKPGWQEKKLGDISIISGDYGLSVPSKPFDGIRYLRITDITEWGNLNDEKVSADFDGEITKEKLEEGDVLFARTGATVGKTLVYRESFGDCLYAGYLIRYRINKKEVLPQFLHYFTHSKDYFDWVLLNQKAAAQPNINAKKYNGLVIKFPSIAEQQTVINYLDSLFSKLHELEGINQEIVAECDALKQALLRQIFE